MFEYMSEAEEVADQIAKLYLKSSRYLSNELDKIFSRFRRKHHLSEAEARQLLNKMQDKASLDELKRVLRQEKDDAIKAELLAELEAPAYQARLEHLQQRQNQIDMVMRDVYGQEKVRNTSFYVDLANESFCKSMFDIQQRAGYGFAFSAISAEKIDRVINSRWSGMNYSDRIWRNTAGLAQTLKEELLLSLIIGRTDRETAEIINNKFATGASNARRLVRTEASFLANEMEAESYQECGIEYYIYVATLDLWTCKKDCVPLDNKRFKVSLRKIGINYPPMHPWCRCITIAYISAEDLARMKRWARAPVTGKTMYVPADMTYEEWHKSYVEGNPEAELQERMAKNRSKDRTQHKSYERLLGKDVPERLDDFQRIKYTDAEKWKYMKLDYRRRKELSDHPELKLPDADKAVVPDSKFMKYLFGGNNKDGLPKGKNFEERLGYNIDNWRMLQKEIRGRASEYPVTFKGNEGFGNRYEQKIVLYGLKGKPANVVVGWIHKSDGTMSMTSTYIKEV
jgi:SPP1 gp7 family putative phage head morphogenesis protein